MNKTKRGFTLVELLLVIAILGILSTFVAVGVINAQKKSRDDKRRADIQTIASALEMYKAEFKRYLENCTGSECDGGSWTESGSDLSKYISPIPTDPLANRQSEYQYEIFSDSNGEKYAVIAMSEVKESEAVCFQVGEFRVSAGECNTFEEVK